MIDAGREGGQFVVKRMCVQTSEKKVSKPDMRTVCRIYPKTANFSDEAKKFRIEI